MKFTQRFVSSLLLCSLGIFSISGEALSAVGKKPSSGMPGRRVGAGVRGPDDICLRGSKTHVAIMPSNNLGLTAQAKPTLLFYLPEISANRTLEFVLRDQNDQLVYSKTVTTNGDDGIIRLNLASSEMKALEIGQNYRWYFSLICNPNDRFQDITSYGWIRRVDRVASLPKAAEPENRLEAGKSYAEAGLWLDALATVDQLRRYQSSRPQATTLWQEWLRDPTIDLPALGQESLIASPFTDSH